MKKLIQICLMLCLVSSAAAQEPPQKVLRAYDWNDLISHHPFPNSEIVSMDGMFVLKIKNTNHAPLEITLLTITNSSLLKKAGLLSCDLKFENVQGAQNWPLRALEQYENAHPIIPARDGGINGNGFGAGGLELLRQFPPDTFGGDENTNRSWYLISDTSNWRPCLFAVANQPNQPRPTQLELNFYLPAMGTVYLRPIKLLGVTPNPWASQWMGVVGGVLIGGMGGTFIGFCGALIGCLVGLGKARRFVLALTKTLIAFGIILIIGGIVAAASKQSWAVWYPLVLLGGITTLVCSVNLYPIKRRYDDLEIRRMTSMDATGR